MLVGRVFAVLLMLAAAGCASMGSRVPLTARFDAKDAAYVFAEGKAHVRGQAFVRRNSGKLLRATGTDVYLIARTAYAQEQVARIFRGKQALGLPRGEPLFNQYSRTTIASSGGSFDFEGVADGDYYVIAMIHMPSDYTFTQFAIMEEVSVRNGKSVKLVMRGY